MTIDLNPVIIPPNSIASSQILDANITPPKLNGAQSGSAPIFGVRAWVNFNGTGTVAIRASGNVSSITDNGVGDYTINFQTLMPDTNYCIVGSSGGQNSTSLGTIYTLDQTTPRTTSLCRIMVFTSLGASVDTPNVEVMVIR